MDIFTYCLIGLVTGLATVGIDDIVSLICWLLFWPLLITLMIVEAILP